MRAKRSTQFYREKILEMMGECIHSGEFDQDEFENKVSGLKAAASVDGVPQKVFLELVDSALRKEEYKKVA